MLELNVSFQIINPVDKTKLSHMIYGSMACDIKLQQTIASNNSPSPKTITGSAAMTAENINHYRCLRLNSKTNSQTRAYAGNTIRKRS